MTNTRTPIDPDSLVKGAKVTIEGTVERRSGGHTEVKIGRHTYILHDDYAFIPTILSVTPPPTDWSKVKRAVFQDEAADIVATDRDIAWIRFDRGGNKLVSLASLKPLVSLAPLLDEPSAGEASEIHHTAVCARAQDEYSACDCGAAPDTRPAWQRAEVGDVVSVRGTVTSADDNLGPAQRLVVDIDGEESWPLNRSILDIVEKADENR